MRRAAALLLLACAALLLPGCVWLRLLDLKAQMQDFDRHLAVRPGPPLELRFLAPPLLAEDVPFLVGAPPSAVAGMPGGAVWTYAFYRLGPDGQAAVPVRALLLTAVVRDGRLAAIAFPEEVLRVVPGPLLEAGLRSLARARVDRSRFSATAQVEASPDLALPQRARLAAELGEPSRVDRQADGGERWVWRYRLAGGDPARPPVIGMVAFHFPPGAGLPSRFSTNLNGKWLYLDLPRRG